VAVRQKVVAKLAPKGTFRRLYYECQRIHNAGGPYVFGGGHGKPLSRVFSSQGTDCSSSCSLALWRAGFYESGWATNSTGFMRWGKPGKGKRWTMWANPRHCWIQFHVKGFAWRFDTSPWGSGGRGPRLRWGARSTVGFVARHH
jgi:hypothetical protein